MLAANDFVFSDLSHRLRRVLPSLELAVLHSQEKGVFSSFISQWTWDESNNCVCIINNNSKRMGPPGN